MFGVDASGENLNSVGSDYLRRREPLRLGIGRAGSSWHGTGLDDIGVGFARVDCIALTRVGGATGFR